MTNRDAAKEQPWFKRLKNLATNEKTPEAIAKDLVCALHTIECHPSPAADVVKAIRDDLSRILGPQGTPSGPGLLNILTEYVVANSSADVKALREKIIDLIDGHIEDHLGFITSPAKVLKMLRTDILTLLATSGGRE